MIQADLNSQFQTITVRRLRHDLLVQDKLVRLDPRGHRLIRGVAGSGKTTIALYRAKYLSENYLDMFTANKILVLTYNSTLVAFMREQAKRVGVGRC